MGAAGVVQANRWLLLAAVPVFLVLAGALYFTVNFARDEREQQAWVTHTYVVIGTLQSLIAHAADAETGQRGYLLTREISYLEPYDRARREIGRDLGALADLTRDNPQQQLRVREIKRLVEGRLTILQQGIAQSDGVRPMPPAALNLLDQGRAAMDSLRAIVSLGLADEHRILAERIAARRAVERAGIVAGLLAVALALVVLLIAAAMLIRGWRRARRSGGGRRRSCRRRSRTSATACWCSTKPTGWRRSTTSSCA